MHYRSQGYFLSRAFIPPQPLETGIIKIKVLEGVIEETAIEGTDHRNGLIRSQLKRIEEERPATLSTMERMLLLIGDIPGIAVQDAVLEEIERATGRFKLTAVLDRTQATAYASLDNRGTPDAGRSEIWATASALGIGSIIDRLQAGVFTVPEAPSELLYGEVRAARLLGTAGLEIEAMISASQNEPGPDGTETIGVESASRRASISASIPLYRRRESSLWGRVELDAREIEDTSDGTPLYTDNLRVLRTRLQGFTQAMGGYS